MPQESHAPTHHRVTVLGRPVEYTVGGHGETVLFLHGWGLSHRTYEHALRLLTHNGLRVLAPSLPGFGTTARLPRAAESLTGYAHWADAFLRAVEVRGPAVVVGHSFGGGVAIQLAHDHPAHVRGLVLVNSIGGSAWTRDGSTVRAMKERPLWDWGLHFSRDLLPLRQLRRVVPVIVSTALPNLARDPRTFLRTAELARTADLTAELEELKRRRLPVAVLWGRDDRIVTEASTDALCEALEPADRITVPGGHGWMLADPEGFGEVMTNVLPIAARNRTARSASA